jgi:hypothetical protein
MGDTIFCEYEAARFPRGQFDESKKHGLVHARPPDDSTPPHTAMGDPLSDDSSSGGGGGEGEGPFRTGGTLRGPVMR